MNTPTQQTTADRSGAGKNSPLNRVKNERPDTASAAVGHWPSLLTAAGVDPAHLVNKHGPCPVCGGSDRFRFDDKDGRGTWLCNQCGGPGGDGGGGDGFGLLQRVLNTDFKGAARFVDEHLGLTRPTAAKASASDAKPIPERPHSHARQGTPSAVWTYRDRHGQPVFWVYRFETTEGKKEFRPLHWSGKAWEWKDPAGKLPLYRLDSIHAAKGAALLFCEGEKAADAADAGGFFPGHAATTTAHGAQSPGKSDFAPVKGRPCLIWPDADAPGAVYADKLASLLHQAGAAVVEVLELPQGLPPGTDAADAAALDFTPEQVQAWPRRVYLPPEGEIVTTDKRLSDLSDAALSALAARNSPARLFVQNGRLVRITHAKGTDGGRVLNLTPIDLSTLKHELERAALWKRKGRDGELAPIVPPDTVCADILALPDYDNFPSLERVVTAPCVSKAGHVISTPGFDLASGLFYHQAEALAIPDTTPTPEAVKRALALIQDEWLADFPFDLDCPAATEGELPTASSSKAHALALFLLPFARQLIEGVAPLHFVTAPTQRTGKSLLVEVVAGVFDPLVSPGAAPEGRDNDSEWRKRITAAMSTESAFIWVDNVKGMVDTGALEGALTARYWTDRTLGSHKQVTLKNDRVWVATGNNAELSQDLYGRAVEIRLDANMETPSERQDFKITNIRKWTRRRRGELCAAALVLIRNWLQAGRPGPAEGTPMLGGFEEWRRVMGGILTAAGVQGFLRNRAVTKGRVNAADDVFRAFIEKWAAAHPRAIPMPPKDLRAIAQEAGLFEDVIVAQNEAGEVRSLGRWLTKNTDRVLSGYKIRRGKTSSKSHNGYYLQQLTKPGMQLSGVSGNTSEPITAKIGETGETGVKNFSVSPENAASPVSPVSPVHYAPDSGARHETPLVVTQADDSMRF